MPRKPRIEIAGYYHIINRGVEQRVVFKEAEDYEYFEELMCFYAKSYGITIHLYLCIPLRIPIFLVCLEEQLGHFLVFFYSHL